MKKIFIFLIPSLILLLGISVKTVALAQVDVCSPGICCGTSTCAVGAIEKEASDCPDMICCYDNSNRLTGPAQCNLAEVGQQICSGQCATNCQPGQSIAQTTDCTEQDKKCCIGTPTPPTSGGDGFFNPNDLSPVGDIDVPTLIGVIVKGAMGIIGSIALLMFVYGGFIMMISQGDATKITKGKTAMVWSSVGILIIFGSYIFISYIIAGLTTGGSSDSGAVACGQGYSCQLPVGKTCGTTPSGACIAPLQCCK